MRRIGVLINLTADDPEGHARITAFAQGLQEAGWTTGRNVRIDYRWGGAGADAMANYAAELVALAPDVILAATSVSVAALQRITRTIPIVFVQVIDPVSAGFVASLARPSGNATGVHEFRAWHEWEMVGASQRSRTPRHAGGCHPRPHHCCTDRAGGRHPVGGTPA